MFRRRQELDAAEGVDVGRSARRGAGSLLYILLVVVAVGVVLAISMNVRKRWDLSVRGWNSLSPQSIDVLNGLHDDVYIYALFTSSLNRPRELYWELLRLYQMASPRVHVEFIDPVARPGAVKDIGLDPQDENARRDGISVIKRGERKLVFFGIQEEDVTNAILEVGTDTRRVVGFLRGYGEREAGSDLDTGIGRAVEALRREYYDIRDVSVSAGIPADVSVLVAAGFRAPVPDEDLQRIAGWLAGGGRLLALVDPGPPTGLERILIPWGVRPTGMEVLEPGENKLYGRPEFIRITDYTTHPIARGFGKNLPIALAVSAAVEHFEPSEPGLLHDALARSSPFSIALAADGGREQGPFDVAVASWKRIEGEGDIETETRVVLVGDSDFITNQYLPQLANQNFFLNCIGWLSREKGLVSIRRQPLAGQSLGFRRREWWLTMGITMAAPAMVILIGIVVASRRRML